MLIMISWKSWSLAFAIWMIRISMIAPPPPRSWRSFLVFYKQIELLFPFHRKSLLFEGVIKQMVYEKGGYILWGEQNAGRRAVPVQTRPSQEKTVGGKELRAKTQISIRNEQTFILAWTPFIMTCVCKKWSWHQLTRFSYFYIFALIWFAHHHLGVVFA